MTPEMRATVLEAAVDAMLTMPHIFSDHPNANESRMWCEAALKRALAATPHEVPEGTLEPSREALAKWLRSQCFALDIADVESDWERLGDDQRGWLALADDVRAFLSLVPREGGEGT